MACHDARALLLQSQPRTLAAACSSPHSVPANPMMTATTTNECLNNSWHGAPPPRPCTPPQTLRLLLLPTLLPLRPLWMRLRLQRLRPRRMPQTRPRLPCWRQQRARPRLLALLRAGRWRRMRSSSACGSSTASRPPRWAVNAGLPLWEGRGRHMKVQGGSGSAACPPKSAWLL